MTPKWKTKNALCMLRHKQTAEIRALKKNIAALEACTDSSDSSDEKEDCNPLIVSKALRKSMLPGTKVKAKRIWSAEDIPRGFNNAFRKTVGTNLSNVGAMEQISKTPLQQGIQAFFSEPFIIHITKISPIEKEVKKVADGTSQPVRCTSNFYLKVNTTVPIKHSHPMFLH